MKTNELPELIRERGGLSGVTTKELRAEASTRIEKGLGPDNEVCTAYNYRIPLVAAELQLRAVERQDRASKRTLLVAVIALVIAILVPFL